MTGRPIIPILLPILTDPSSAEVQKISLPSLNVYFGDAFFSTKKSEKLFRNNKEGLTTQSYININRVSYRLLDW